MALLEEEADRVGVGLRVAIELLRRPKVLLLDEPTSGLDAKASLSLVRTLAALAGGACPRWPSWEGV